MLFGFKWKWHWYLWHSELHSPHFSVPFSMRPKDVVAYEKSNGRHRIKAEWRFQLNDTYELRAIACCGIRHSWSLYGGEIYCKIYLIHYSQIKNCYFVRSSAQHNQIPLSYVYLRGHCVHCLNYCWLAVISLEMKTFLVPPECVIYFRWQPSTVQHKRVRMCRCEYLLFPPPLVHFSSSLPPPPPPSSY